MDRMSQAPEKEVLEVGTLAGSPNDPAERAPAGFQWPHAVQLVPGDDDWPPATAAAHGVRVFPEQLQVDHGPETTFDAPAGSQSTPPS